MAFYLNNHRLIQGIAFVDENGTQYPANWLDLSTPEEKKRVGIVEREPKPENTKKQKPVQQYLDDYNPKEKGRYIRDAEGNKVTRKGLRKIAIEREREEYRKALEPTNWYSVVQAEFGDEMPQDIAELRSKIRDAHKQRVQLILDCETPRDLKVLQSNLSKIAPYS